MPNNSEGRNPKRWRQQRNKDKEEMERLLFQFLDRTVTQKNPPDGQPYVDACAPAYRNEFKQLAVIGLLCYYVLRHEG